MRTLIGLAAVLSIVALAGCRGGGGHAKWQNEHALECKNIEVQVDASGKYTEIEYHIAPDRVPATVRSAMDKLHPGGLFDDAEMEWNHGKLYYELSRKVNGMEVEAMFAPDGTLYSEEIQIPMSKVPEHVQKSAMASMTGGQATKWEEIRNADRAVTAYHVKMTRGANKYKLMFSADGKYEGMVREVPAEIEVPAK